MRGRFQISVFRNMTGQFCLRVQLKLRPGPCIADGVMGVPVFASNFYGRLGPYGSFRLNMSQIFDLKFNVDFTSVWLGKYGPYMTQGFAVDLRIAKRKEPFSFGFGRYNRHGGGSENWSNLEWGGGDFNVTTSSTDVTYNFGIGLGIGGGFNLQLIEFGDP